MRSVAPSAVSTAKAPGGPRDWFYQLSLNTNYIRADRIARDVKWVYESDYGPLDITINLSKPEKDPKAIAAAKLAPSPAIQSVSFALRTRVTPVA